ncbi:hypothetical protein [Staphylococcus petrasii]|uniref:hypothetical protein n=1 Tax=Staphylococcus petrasii TaxID=1276936 RepID=UPI001981C742|nr:hypothetical protein [Staphylococcus petrasii]
MARLGEEAIVHIIVVLLFFIFFEKAVPNSRQVNKINISFKKKQNQRNDIIVI